MTFLLNLLDSLCKIIASSKLILCPVSKLFPLPSCSKGSSVSRINDTLLSTFSVNIIIIIVLYIRFKILKLKRTNYKYIIGNYIW